MLIPQSAALRDIFCTNEKGLILMVRQQAGILRSAASNRPAFDTMQCPWDKSSYKRVFSPGHGASSSRTVSQMPSQPLCKYTALPLPSIGRRIEKLPSFSVVYDFLPNYRAAKYDRISVRMTKGAFEKKK